MRAAVDAEGGAHPDAELSKATEQSEVYLKPVCSFLLKPIVLHSTPTPANAGFTET